MDEEEAEDLVDAKDWGAAEGLVAEGLVVAEDLVVDKQCALLTVARMHDAAEQFEGVGLGGLGIHVIAESMSLTSKVHTGDVKQILAADLGVLSSLEQSLWRLELGGDLSVTGAAECDAAIGAAEFLPVAACCGAFGDGCGTGLGSVGSGSSNRPAITEEFQCDLEVMHICGECVVEEAVRKQDANEMYEGVGFGGFEVAETAELKNLTVKVAVLSELGKVGVFPGEVGRDAESGAVAVGCGAVQDVFGELDFAERCSLAQPCRATSGSRS